MDVELRLMAGKVSWNSSLRVLLLYWSCLTIRMEIYYDSTSCRPCISLGRCSTLDRSLVHYVDALPFDLGGKVVSFFILKFGLIIGLNIKGHEAARDGTQRIDRLYDTYFQGQGMVFLLQLIGTIMECYQMLDRLNLGLVYIIESVVRCHHKRLRSTFFIWKFLTTSMPSTTIRGSEMFQGHGTRLLNKINVQFLLVN